MSVVTETVDLTLYGCPMHYIKAREAIAGMALEQEILLLVNNGSAVEEVLTSLRHDGQQAGVESTHGLITTIRVVKKCQKLVKP
jgi:TusA-related sulfurtransferase